MVENQKQKCNNTLLEHAIHKTFIFMNHIELLRNQCIVQCFPYLFPLVVCSEFAILLPLEKSRPCNETLFINQGRAGFWALSALVKGDFWLVVKNSDIIFRLRLFYSRLCSFCLACL